MKNLKNLDLTQKIAIAIPVLFFLSCLTKHYLENFRGTWIYAYGSTGSLFLSIFLVIFSFANSVLILRDLKLLWQKKALWFLLSASVFLLVVVLILIAML